MLQKAEQEIAESEDESMDSLSEEEAKVYRSMIGTLNYFALASRYDIAQCHALSVLSQFSAQPNAVAAAGVTAEFAVPQAAAA